MSDCEINELADKAVLIMKQERRISTALIQRRLKLGYCRAYQVMKELEARGFIRVNTQSGTAPVDIMIPLAPIE